MKFTIKYFIIAVLIKQIIKYSHTTILKGQPPPPPMKIISISQILVFLNLVLCFFMIIFLFQRKIYLLNLNYELKERDEHRAIKLKARDGTPIDLRFIDRGANVDLFVYFGNALQERFYSDFSKVLTLSGIKCNVFTYIPRGFINNPGIPSEKSITLDLETIGKYLSSRKNKRYALGVSFGCAIVLKLTTNCSFDSISLINPFVSLRRVVKSFEVYYLMSFALVDTWDNTNYINKLKETKITIFTSELDTLVHPENSKILKKYNENIKQVVLPGIEHNEAFNYNYLIMAIRELYK